MAKSGGRGSGGGRDEPTDDEGPAQLIRALDHYVRRCLLRLLHTSAEPRSPVRMAKELNVPLSTVSYHVTVLRNLGAVRKDSERQVRGAIEHFYASTIADNETAQALLAQTEEADRRRQRGR